MSELKVQPDGYCPELGEYYCIICNKTLIDKYSYTRHLGFPTNKENCKIDIIKKSGNIPIVDGYNKITKEYRCLTCDQGPFAKKSCYDEHLKTIKHKKKCGLIT